MRGDIVEYGEIPCGRERKVVCWLAHFAEVYGASVGVPEYRASLALDQLPKLFAMTLNATKPFLEAAGIHSDNTLDESELAAVNQALVDRN
jgi:hypothetical protein